MKKIRFNQDVKKEHFPSFAELSFIFYKSNKGLFFRVSIGSSKQSEELGEFSTVMQTLNCVSGLHNCFEFSELSQLFR